MADAGFDVFLEDGLVGLEFFIVVSSLVLEFFSVDHGAVGFEMLEGVTVSTIYKLADCCEIMGGELRFYDGSAEFVGDARGDNDLNAAFDEAGVDSPTHDTGVFFERALDVHGDKI